MRANWPALLSKTMRADLHKRQAAMKAKHAPRAVGIVGETLYTPSEVAEMVKFSTDWVRRRFRREPGVLKSGNVRQRMRIPESVVERVCREMSG